MKSHIWYYHGTSKRKVKDMLDKDHNINIILNYYNKHKHLKPTNIKYHTYDFGPGFYLTKNKEQAKKWARKRASIDFSKPKLFRCDLKSFLSHRKVFRFHENDFKFLRCVRYCRISGRIPTKFKRNYSAIFGPMIDGKLGTFIRVQRSKFLLGNKDMHKVIKSINIPELKKKANTYPFPKINQLCIIDNSSLKYLNDIHIDDINDKDAHKY